MKRHAAIFDVDGTLANVSPIRHYVRPSASRPWKDFDAFHAASVNVEPNAWVADLARAAADHFDVVVVTARRARWRHHTAWWLALHNIPSSAMFMRADNDHRPDVEVKRDILVAIQQTWDVVFAVDDNPRIIQLWKEHGIETVEVEGWET